MSSQSRSVDLFISESEKIFQHLIKASQEDGAHLSPSRPSRPGHPKHVHRVGSEVPPEPSDHDGHVKSQRCDEAGTPRSREDECDECDVNPCQSMSLVICHLFWEKHALLCYLDLLTNTWTINDHHIKPNQLINSWLSWSFPSGVRQKPLASPHQSERVNPVCAKLPSHVGTKKPATLGQGEIEVLVQRHATMLLTSHER